MNNKSTICLNMIVKNEAHIIKETLQNLCSYINFSYWVICDTGSTDGTQQIIQEYFKEKGISGELLEHEWKDFGHNRTLALTAAYNKTDYLFVFDADDKLMGNFKLPEQLNKGYYYMRMGKDYSWSRIVIINNRKKWRYRGVLHEYIDPIEPVGDYTTIEGDYYIMPGHGGSRSNAKDKYAKDAKILEEAYAVETDESLKSRYAFYCAQSYRDCEQTDNAILWYVKCIEGINWIQEKWVACYTIGNLYKKKNNMDEALKYWLKTVEYDSERIEGIVDACEYYRYIGLHMFVNTLYNKYKNYDKNPQKKLFLSNYKYNDFLEYYNSISSYYLSDKEQKLTGYECCKKILLNNVAPGFIIEQTKKNIMFYKEFLEKDKNDHKELSKLMDIMNNYTTININNNDIDSIINTYNVSKEKAIVSLIENKLDVINTIMNLTHNT